MGRKTSYCYCNTGVFILQEKWRWKWTGFRFEQLPKVHMDAKNNITWCNQKASRLSKAVHWGCVVGIFAIAHLLAGFIDLGHCLGNTIITGNCDKMRFLWLGMCGLHQCVHMHIQIYHARTTEPTEQPFPFYFRHYIDYKTLLHVYSWQIIQHILAQPHDITAHL